MTEEMADIIKRLDDHDDRLRRGEEQFGLILQGLNANTKAIETLNRNTAGVVQAYQDVQGTARVGAAVWNAVVWLTKAGGVLAAIGYGLHWLINHFKHNPPGQ